MLTDLQILSAKIRTRYSIEVLHEHNDCIRIAYEWLDAQRKIKGNMSRGLPIKHLIEKWGGRYVSTSDVEVAATLHPDIHGKYPYYNLSARLTLPSDRRLAGIGQAMAHDYRDRLDKDAYKIVEL